MSAVKTYEVFLTKSYAVTVKAKSKRQAMRIAEFYTGDVADLSTDEDREEFNFAIQGIDCRMNESFEAEEIPGGGPG